MLQDDKRIISPVPQPRGKAWRSSGWMPYVFMASGLLIVAVILMGISMKLFFKMVSLLGIALTIGSIIVVLLTFRKSREIRPKALAVSIAMSGASLLVYALFLKASLSVVIWLLGFTIGLGVGVGWSLVTPLFREGVAVKRAGNIWYLAVWGAIFVMNQSLIIITGRTQTVSMLLLIFGTGLVVGSSGSYIARYFQMKADG